MFCVAYGDSLVPRMRQSSVLLLSDIVIQLFDRRELARTAVLCQPCLHTHYQGYQYLTFLQAYHVCVCVCVCVCARWDLVYRVVERSTDQVLVQVCTKAPGFLTATWWHNQLGLSPYDQNKSTFVIYLWLLLPSSSSPDLWSYFCYRYHYSAYLSHQCFVVIISSAII
jgi:hypothetical protein